MTAAQPLGVSEGVKWRGKGTNSCLVRLSGVSYSGIPREGVGASNNARGHFGPPSFHDASFVYTGGNMDLKIVIAYL
jgi:Uncharacterized protein conserved in bacteria (DUF2141)